MNHPPTRLTQPLFSLNALLSSHLRNNNPSSTWQLFFHMHQTRSNLDAYTFTPVLGACAALSDKLLGLQVHALFTKTCSKSETIAQTALIDMYFKCSCFSNSVRVFEEVENKDPITWNTMITGLVHNDRPRYALTVFEEMCEEKLHFSEYTLCSVLKACSSLKALRLGKQVHGLVIVMSRDMLVLGTTLISLYSSCGLTDEALNVFRSLNCRKDTAIYNALVSGLLQNRKFKEFFLIMSNMKPNEVVLTSGLAMCSMNSDLFIGKQIHCVAIRFGFDLDTQLSNALLDMYAKCGKVSAARLLFDSIPHKTIFTWTSIIDGYGSQGCGVEAYTLFKAMEGSGISPNSVTFLTVLSACGHSGLVEEGRLCFISMKERYGIDPGPEHYACFIDLLGRAGLMEEVWDLFIDMRAKSIPVTGPVLATLLNACRANLDVEKGEFAAKCLIELEPDKSENLVSISNFYAAIGRWDHVEDLRNMMIENTIKKGVGSSWVS